MKQKIQITPANHNEQILKYYFPEFPVKFRKQILKGCLFDDPERVNEYVYKIYKKIEDEKEKNNKILFESIIFNSLGYERNETLKDSVYQDYHNKLISKHGKQFVNGQYQIFRNDNEKIILKDYQNANDVTLRLCNTITQLAKMSIDEIISLEDVITALNKDSKAINGIINKVLNK